MLAKTLLTVATLIFTVLPPFADFNKTHALHPKWPGHARFHMVWLVVENSLVGLLALTLIWYQSTPGKLLIGGGISVLVLGSFLLATLTMPLYSGALSDPGGVPQGPKGIDLNLAVFGVGFLLSLAGLITAFYGI